MSQRTGRVYVTVKGARLASKPGAVFKMGGVKRTPVLGESGILGYEESTEAGSIECVISHAADISLKDFQAMTNETLAFDTDSGKSFQLREAFCEGALELSKGEVKLVFFGTGDEV